MCSGRGHSSGWLHERPFISRYEDIHFDFIDIHFPLGVVRQGRAARSTCTHPATEPWRLRCIRVVALSVPYACAARSAPNDLKSLRKLEMPDKWYLPCPPGRGADGCIENAASIAFCASRGVTVRAAPSSQPPACRQRTFHAVTFVPSRCRPPDLFLHVPERHRSAAEAKNHGLKNRPQSMILSSSLLCLLSAGSEPR